MYVGDCNFECNVTNVGYNIFADFADRCNLMSCDSLSNRENASTYHHETLGHKSYLNHVFLSYVLKQYVCDYEILDNVLNTSNHLPVSFCLMVSCDVYQATVHSKSSRAILTCLGPWARQADGAPIIPMAHVEGWGP